jgi:hypothetical protein
MRNKIRGSATVEASITLPIFLMAVLSVCSLMQYAITYRQVGSAMSDAARMLSAGGYLAHLSGLQAVGNDMERVAADGFVMGGEKLNEVTNALSSLAANPMDESGSNGGNAGTISIPDTKPVGTLEAFEALSRVLTSGTGKLVGKAFNSVLDDIVLALSTARLKQSGRMLQSEIDPWRILGIQNGAKGVDLTNSHYFSEDGYIELVAVYTVKPNSLFGAAPAIKCCNRIRVISWGAGVGPALRRQLTNKNDSVTGNASESSLWNNGNDASQLWQRGKAIEGAELGKLESRIQGNGEILFPASAFQPGFDALSVGMDINRATAFQIVSVNPFLETYRDNPSALKDLARKQASRMPKSGDRLPAGKDGLPVCISAGYLMLIVPENAPEWLNAAIAEEKSELARIGISLELIRGYGTYDGPGTESSIGAKDSETGNP